MRLDRLDAQKQFPGDRLVALASGRQLTDLALAWSERRDTFKRGATWTHAGRDKLAARALCQQQRPACIGVGQRRSQRLSCLDTPAQAREGAAKLEAQTRGLEYRG